MGIGSENGPFLAFQYLIHQISAVRQLDSTAYLCRKEDWPVWHCRSISGVRRS